MRTFKYKKRLPRKKIFEIMKAIDYFDSYNFENLHRTWYQVHLYSSELNNILAECLGVQPYKIKNVIAHVIRGEVPNHADNLSTGVYLIPLKFCKTAFFYEGRDAKRFANDTYIKFNDHNHHGVYSPENSRNIIISIDT